MDCKVYVGNLSEDAIKSDVESGMVKSYLWLSHNFNGEIFKLAFSKYGPLKNVWVARKPPGFAFVQFEDSRDAEDAVKALDGT